MSNNSLEELHFNIIEQYFNSTSLVSHHIDSYNHFYNHGIKEVLHDLNPLHFSAEADRYQIKLYFGGKRMDKLFFGKPTIHENSKMKLLFPNEARLRNITYASSLHCNIDIEFYDIKQHKKIPIETSQIQKYYMGMIPIMLQSNPCHLYSLSAQTRYSLGECKHDYGGYFIIDGKEKALIPQEVYANNMIYIREVKDNIHDYSVEIRSISKDETKPKRTFAIRRVMRNEKNHNEHFVVFIPNVRKEVPLFILFRALGLCSDKGIITTILGDLEDKEDYMELLRPSVIDSGGIYTQKQAIQYISELTKEKNDYNTHYILCDFLLPHIGEMNYVAKCHFLGYMIFETLKVIQKIKMPTDRDHFKYKRVETCGTLMKQLFSEYATIMYKEFHKNIEMDYNFNKGKYIKTSSSENSNSNTNNEQEEKTEIQMTSFMNLIMDNHGRFFQDKIIHNGFQKAFKGNWGAYSHTKRIGAIQPLNRLSYNSALSHLRKINLDIDSSSKMTGPHKLHSSQWGVIDPVDTPDGGNVGLHKHMALMCGITHHMDDTPLIQWIFDNMNQQFSVHGKTIQLDCIRLEKTSTSQLNTTTKIFVNNKIIGITSNPFMFKKLFLNARRLHYIPLHISFLFDIKDNYIFIFCDEGRLIRPVLYLENDGYIGYLKNKDLFIKIQNNALSWQQYTHGFMKHDKIYTNIGSEFHSSSTQEKKSILEYLDKSEEESTYICLHANEIDGYNKHSYTHCEIHPSMMFGIMGSQVIFPEHNQLPRNLFSCGQSKQAASLYHSNFFCKPEYPGIEIRNGKYYIY